MTLSSLIKESIKHKEEWHYTSLLPYVGLDIKNIETNQNINLPEKITTYRLVFVDGKLSNSMSSLKGIPDALIAIDKENKYNYKLVLGGQTCLAIDPIEILYINSENEEPNEIQTNLEIKIGENSRLTLLERHISSENALQVRHHKTNILLSAQSKLIHGKIVKGNDNTLHVSQINASVSGGAFYDYFGLVVGGNLTRCEKDISLVDNFAGVKLIDGMILRKKEHGDITSVVRHLSPNTSSNQICKTVLADKSNGVFQGKVFVNSEAQKTDAYQLCRSLLLSNQAEMNAKPELEIYADDVKCSHGTAIGDLDEDALFYLRSRGIDEKEARRILIDAFIGDLINNIISPDISNCVKKEIEKWTLV